MPPEAAACPADETFLALIEGRLEETELTAIDSHLDECALCREVVASLGSGPRLKSEPVGRADVIGRFLVLERIGEGAMGVVFAAYDPELERKVALKLLRAERGDARARARLTREAQALARLSHPNVVTVYDVGTRGDDVYVAMELIEGVSLREWLREKRDLSAVLEVFRGAGEGLAAAHDAGLVHRDFKPENVLVDERGAPRVVDFGLARGDGEPVGAVPEGALLTASLTRTGALLGTPAYMAPEQLAGEPADARADQFAFCVALWEALAGQRPFSGSSVAELRAAIHAGPPAASIERRVASALRRGLSPAPAARFGSMRALLDALARPRVSSGWITLGALAGLLTLGAVGAAVSGAPEDPCATSATALDDAWSDGARAAIGAELRGALDTWAGRWTTARVAACRATHVTHEQSPDRMDRRMACLDRQRSAFELVAARAAAADARAIDAFETLPDPDACALDASVDPPPTRDREAVDRLRRRIDEGRIAVAIADHARGLALGAQCVTEAERLGYAPAVAEAGVLHASALRAVARFDDAEAAAEASVLAAARAGDDRGAADAWLERVRVAGSRGRFADAHTWSRYADAAIARSGAPADLRAELLHARGVVRTNLGELADAEADLRDALDLVAASQGPDASRLASLYSSLGDLLRIDSRYEDALAAHERALSMDRAALGDTHPRVGRDLHNVAGVLRRMDRRAEARERYLHALAIKRAAFGDDHPEVGLTRNSLGLLAYEAQDLPEARQQWERAAAILDSHNHGDAALAHFNLALLELGAEHWTAAEEHIRRAIAMDTERIGPGAKRVGSAHVLLARALVGLRRYDEARESVGAATTIASELGDPQLAREAEAALGPPSSRAPRARAPRAPTSTPAPADPPPPAASVAPPPAPLDPDPNPAAPPSAAPSPRPAGSGSYGATRAWE